MTSRPISNAAVRLKTALTPRMTQRRLAKLLGVSGQAVNSWLRGRSRPAPEQMAAIQRLLGIPMTAWIECHAPEELPKAG